MFDINGKPDKTTDADFSYTHPPTAFSFATPQIFRDRFPLNAPRPRLYPVDKTRRASLSHPAWRTMQHRTSPEGIVDFARIQAAHRRQICFFFVFHSVPLFRLWFAFNIAQTGKGRFIFNIAQPPPDKFHWQYKHAQKEHNGTQNDSDTTQPHRGKATESRARPTEARDTPKINTLIQKAL